MRGDALLTAELRDKARLRALKRTPYAMLLARLKVGALLQRRAASQRPQPCLSHLAPTASQGGASKAPAAWHRGRAATTRCARAQQLSNSWRERYGCRKLWQVLLERMHILQMEAAGEDMASAAAAAGRNMLDTHRMPLQLKSDACCMQPLGSCRAAHRAGLPEAIAMAALAAGKRVSMLRDVSGGGATGNAAKFTLEEVLDEVQLMFRWGATSRVLPSLRASMHCT